MLQQLTSAQAELHPVTAERDSLKDQLAETETRNDSLSSEYDAMSHQLESLTHQLSAKTKAGKSHEDKVRQLTQSLELAESERAHTKEQLIESSAAQDDLKSHLQEAKSQKDALAQQVCLSAVSTCLADRRAPHFGP